MIATLAPSPATMGMGGTLESEVRQQPAHRHRIASSVKLYHPAG